MEKIILVDGNNLLFRSYYATAYNGNFMKNSKDFPTNALFGFANMMNKIVLEEKPVYIVVAFDKGKTFRHEEYEDYKAGRMETPDELKVQFPKAKELLTHMGIKYYEIDHYEADDIIGTFARFCNKDSNYVGTIISSDKDLLQLLSDDVDIKLLKPKDYIRYNRKSFMEEYGIEPIRVIDLKALQGDTSDNIPGVKGVGEKTALKLLQEYKTLDGIYEHLDDIGGKLQEKLENGKEDAYKSYYLATIIQDVPIDICLEDIRYLGSNDETLNQFYEELEFYSFLKREKIMEQKPINFQTVTSLDQVKVEGSCAVYLELLGSNYHTGKVLGMAVYNESASFFIPAPLLKEKPSFLVENEKYMYDIKKAYVALKWLGITLENVTFDGMVAGYLLDYNVKEDIAYLANIFDEDIPFYENIYGKAPNYKEPSFDIIAYHAIMKARFIYETKHLLEERMNDMGVYDLYHDIELPLTFVLGDMEYQGVCVDQKELVGMGEEIKIRLHEISQEIYTLVDEEFQITSPKELGRILFEKLGLPHGKKGVRGYSTAVDVLNKLKGMHPIIELVMEHRMLMKLYTTYIEGLQNTILNDQKIHTIYMQTLTRTGRLSSIEPNLQNIPVRTEYGRLIRKAFVASSNSVILSADYSQIELRILAHMSGVEALIQAFLSEEDIHRKTASDIFKVPLDEVTKDMRRIAKAVNFGIIYGISSFGLSENLDIPPKDAKEFIDHYLKTYPGVKEYMDQTIKNAYVDGYVKTLFGRRRNIVELQNKNHMIKQQGERMALNTPIQGTSADIIKMAMVAIHKELKMRNLKTKMILQVHDELLFDVVLEELEEVMQLVSKIMEQICQLKVPLKVLMEYGENWYQAK